MSGSRAAVGFTVKSGWAAAVLLVEKPHTPEVADSRRVALSDPTIPDSAQPYHAGFGTARDAGRELARLVASVTRFGRVSVTAVLRGYRTVGHDLAGAGLVVGSLTDPDRIANDHIRIHALEGQLFRTVVKDAAERAGIPTEIWRERDLYTAAARALQRPEPRIRETIAALGRGVDGPWRAEQKGAALAAWMTLVGR